MITHGRVGLGLDLHRPSASRISNWLLGGDHHWAIDRAAGGAAVTIMPALARALTANRTFVADAVRMSVTCGIRQFVDIGCGSPLRTTLHDLAADAPDSRCVYVDTDPIAVAHTEVMLDQRGDPDRHAVVHADIRTSMHLWSSVVDTGVLDPNQPMAFIVSSTLPFLPSGDDVTAAITHYKQLLPRGSVLVASHVTLDGAPSRRKRQLVELAALGAQISPKISFRTRDEFTALLTDLTLIDPGVASVPEWRAHHAVARGARSGQRSGAGSCVLAAVARKP